MIDFGSNLKTLVEDKLDVKVVPTQIVQIGENRVSLQLNGHSEEIEAILDSLKTAPTDAELEKLSQEGIEINFLNEEGCAPYSTDIVKTDNGLFYKGRRVVIHIATAHPDKNRNTPIKQLHKYHLHYCEELKKQKAQGNLEKYRVSLSRDGTFHYVFKDGAVPNQKLYVCRRCLSDFNPGVDYRTLDVVNFDLQKFFDSQPQTLQNGDSPKLLFDGLDISGMDMDYQTLSDEYRKDWRKISIQRKKAVNYTCQECGWRPKEKKDRKYIHTHHIDKNKSNNLSSNLKVLCIECHYYNYHKTRTSDRQYLKFVDLRNKGLI